MLIQIKVKTGQKISKLECDANKSFIAQLKSEPTRNKANFELIDLVSEYFDIPKNKIRIKLGRYSNIKTIYFDEQFKLI